MVRWLYAKVRSFLAEYVCVYCDGDKIALRFFEHLAEKTFIFTTTLDHDAGLVHCVRAEQRVLPSETLQADLLSVETGAEEVRKAGTLLMVAFK